MYNKVGLLKLAELFKQNEIAVADYYHVCEEKFPKYKEIWSEIEKCERKHAKIFENIKKEIDENPKNWKKGSFSPIVIQIMIDQTREQTEKLKNDQLVKNYALHFIKDVETSLIESNVSKAFITEVEEYNKLLTKIQDDSKQHHEYLMKIIDAEI